VNMVVQKRYSPHTPLPPGYSVQGWECDEHYHWVSGNNESDGTWNHWACWRGAWAHYQKEAAAAAQEAANG
jgi:hypothetical protein